MAGVPCCAEGVRPHVCRRQCLPGSAASRCGSCCHVRPGPLTATSLENHLGRANCSSREGAGCGNGSTGSRIDRGFGFEQRQYVFGAVGCPRREHPPVRQAQGLLRAHDRH